MTTTSPSFIQKIKIQEEKKEEEGIMLEQICIIGCGNWASAIATIVGRNAAALSFCNDTVRMWVYDEPIEMDSMDTIVDLTNNYSKMEDTKTKTNKNTITMNLSQVINTYHINPKYLPKNVTLPKNILAIPDLKQAVQGATLLIFALPHQFITPTLLETIAQGLLIQQQRQEHQEHITTSRLLRGISLIKGGLELNPNSNNTITLLSQRIQQTLARLLQQEFTCGVLMGANLADEVATQQLSECTLACDFSPTISSNSSRDKNLMKQQQHHRHDMCLNEQTRQIFHVSTYFRVQHVTDVITTEVCGALKNIYALGAGFIDALQLGSNTKAALLRIALLEMKSFCYLFFNNNKNSSSRTHSSSCTPELTLWESCGFADLITTCLGGRNRRSAEFFAKYRLNQNNHHHHGDGKYIPPSMTIDTSIQLWQEIEKELLQGQKLQGIWTCQEVFTVLQETHTQDQFPLLSCIYKIAFLGHPIDSILHGIITSSTSTTTMETTNKKMMIQPPLSHDHSGTHQSRL